MSERNDAIIEAKEAASYASTGASWEDDFCAELERIGYVIVPKAAIAWLNGEGEDGFERPENARGAFWWRSEFRRRAGWQ